MIDITWQQMSQMVNFCYDLEYDASDVKEEYDYLFHAQMFALGDRFGIKHLCSYAMTEYKDCFGDDGANDWKEAIESIRFVYNGSSVVFAPFRKMICTTWQQNFQDYWQEEGFRAEYERLLEDVPEFARETLRAWEVKQLRSQGIKI